MPGRRAVTGDPLNRTPPRCHAIFASQGCAAEAHSAAHLGGKGVGAADGVESAVVEQVVLQGHRALGGAGDVDALALGAADPVSKFHHVGHRGRQQNQVHMRRQHDDHLRRYGMQSRRILICIHLYARHTLSDKLMHTAAQVSLICTDNFHLQGCKEQQFCRHPECRHKERTLLNKRMCAFPHVGCRVVNTSLKIDWRRREPGKVCSAPPPKQRRARHHLHSAPRQR